MMEWINYERKYNIYPGGYVGRFCNILRWVYPWYTLSNGEMLTFQYNEPKFLPSLPRHEPLVLDSTAAKYLKDCMRKYYYRFVLGRVPQAETFKAVLDWGKTYHKFREVLDVVYNKDGSILSDKRTDIQGNLFEAMAIMDEYKPLFTPGDKWEFLNKVRLMKSFAKAIEWRKNELNQGRIKVLAVEQPFQVELPDGSLIGGRMDQVIEMSGKIWVRDFKTTSKPQMFYTRNLDPNDQALRYIFSSSIIHYGDSAFKGFNQVQGVMFEILYNSKTVGPEIYTILQPRNAFQIDTWVEDQIFWNKILKMAREEDRWPMSEHNCSFCDFTEVCRAPSEGSMISILKNKFAFAPWDFNMVEQENKDG